MNKSTMKKLLVIFCAGWMVALTWNPILAQDAGLLVNPGFENPYNTVDGEPPREVAQGWAPWHVPAVSGSPTFANLQPEYEPTAPDTSRILEGNNAQLIRSFFATHDGGVFQRVEGIETGTTVGFSVSAYVWSTTFDEVDLSEEDGDVFVQVGIDPTGGTDGQSNAIVWSEAGVEQYDAYHDYSVEAEAAGNAITVFVRTTIGVPVKNNHIYLDQATLDTGGVEAPTATSMPPSATSTNTSAPPTMTETSAPPTATETSMPPTATDTSALPTATDMPEEDTATPTEAAAQPSETPTIDPIPLTATAIVAQATQTTIAGQTATALVPPTQTPNQQALTATAIIAAATATGGAAQTATALVPTASPLPSNTPTVTNTPLPTNTRPPLSETFPGRVLYQVQRGDSVARLAERYDSSIEAIAEANGLDNNFLIRVGQSLIIPVRQPVAPTVAPSNTPSSVVVTATPSGPVPPLGANGLYTTQPGDTLNRIARLFNTNVETLAQLNGIVNLDRIQVGQQLNLPAQPTPQPSATPSRPSQSYQVRSGDTLFRISLRFGVPVAQIAQANNITNINRIFAGQVLIIP